MATKMRRQKKVEVFTILGMEFNSNLTGFAILVFTVSSAYDIYFLGLASLLFIFFECCELKDAEMKPLWGLILAFAGVPTLLLTIYKVLEFLGL